MNQNYIDWKSTNTTSARKSVICALIYRAKNVSSTPEILAKEMDYLQEFLK